MKKLSTNDKEELQARISAFSFSGCDAHFSRDMTRYYKSFVGRDFKLLAQLAVHLLSPYMDDGEKEVWFNQRSVQSNTCNSYMFMHYMCQQVFAYCQPFDPEMVASYESDCSSCVTAILAHFSNLKRKLKVGRPTVAPL